MAAEPPPPSHGALNVDALDAAFEAAVLEIAARDIAMARVIRTRIGPDRYALEWNLPWWIGRAFGIDASTCATLSLGNVIGLAALRLRDDLEDGEVAVEDVASAHRLSEGLLEAALGIYRTLFPPSSPIWPRLDTWLAEWHAATRIGASSQGASQLAARAAPVKASAYGACLIAERGDLFPNLESGLDSALQAMVLFDHLVDWQQDIRAGRWNAFVAHAIGKPPGGTEDALDSTGVYRALLRGDALATYIHEIDSNMRLAIELIADLGISLLEDHLVELNERINEHSHALRTHYRDLAERADAFLVRMP